MLGEGISVQAGESTGGKGTAKHDGRLIATLLLRSLDALMRVGNVLVQVTVSLEALAAVFVGTEKVAHIRVRQLVDIQCIHVVGDVLAVGKVAPVNGLLIRVRQYVHVVGLGRLVDGLTAFVSTAEDNVLVNVSVTIVVATVLAQLAAHLALVLATVNGILVFAQNGAKVCGKVAALKVTAIRTNSVLVVTFLQMGNHLLWSVELDRAELTFLSDDLLVAENLTHHARVC